MLYGTMPGITSPLSAVALGTAWFGTTIPEEDAFRLMDAYAECGGNFLDTAHMYASWVPGGAGKSETTIGRWLKRAQIQVTVATKGADQGMTRDGIRRQLAESLDRLGMDRVPLYWLHRDAPEVPVAEILGWLGELRDEGRITAFACSNWSLARLREAVEYASRTGVTGFSANQIGCSLARVNPAAASGGPQGFMDDATMDFHRTSRLPLVAYSSQAGGFFTSHYSPTATPADVPPNPNIVRYYGTPANYGRLQAALAIAADRGCTANQVALAYLLQQGFPVFPIVGANTVARVRECCGAADMILSAADMARLCAAETPSR